MNFPILSIIIFLPLVGVLFILLNSGDEIKVKKTSFRVSLLTSLLVFIMSLFLWLQFDNTTKDFQFVENKKWIVDFINYRVGVDGISILFVVLTAFITPICIVSMTSKAIKKSFVLFVTLL